MVKGWKVGLPLGHEGWNTGKKLQVCGDALCFQPDLVSLGGSVFFIS